MRWCILSIPASPYAAEGPRLQGCSRLAEMDCSGLTRRHRHSWALAQAQCSVERSQGMKCSTTALSNVLAVPSPHLSPAASKGWTSLHLLPAPGCSRCRGSRSWEPRSHWFTGSAPKRGGVTHRSRWEHTASPAHITPISIQPPHPSCQLQE